MALLTRTHLHDNLNDRHLASRDQSMDVAVSKTERHEFDRLGFVRLPRPVVTPASLAAVERLLMAEVQQTLTDRTFRDLGNGSPAEPQIHEFPHATRREPSLLRSTLFLALARVAAEILEVNRVRLHFDHVILKPSRNGASTSWHQDIAFDPDTDGPMATIWVPFRAVDQASGCLRFIPQSSGQEILRHQRSGHDGMAIVDESNLVEPVYCALPAGGVTVHGSRTLHGSGPNDSDLPRLAWITKFVPEERSRPRAALSNVYRQAKYAWQFR